MKFTHSAIWPGNRTLILINSYIYRVSLYIHTHTYASTCAYSDPSSNAGDTRNDWRVGQHRVAQNSYGGKRVT